MASSRSSLCLLLNLVWGACSASSTFPGQALTIGGLPATHLVGGTGDQVFGDQNISVTWNQAGFTLFNSDFDGSWDAEKIHQLKLLGKRITFTVDLSNVGCACNLALYLIQMPAIGWDGKANAGTKRGGQPKFYCDANKVGGQWCPEMDIMEANNHAFQATPHKCDSPESGVYMSCDRGGCDQSTRDVPDAYGPGEQYVINTKLPFKVQTDFIEEDGKFVGMRTTLLQSGRHVSLNHENCQPEYFDAMTDAMASGMSLRITYWGDDADTMSWMDVPPCGMQSCSKSGGKAAIRQISVEKLSENVEEEEQDGEEDASAALGFSDIIINGLDSTIQSLVGTGGEAKKDKLKIDHNSGFTLFSDFKGKWDPKKITELKLLGKMLSFTVDLSKVGCACNLALYLISMPARDVTGKPHKGKNRGGQPGYYCDANQVGGQWCPEIDLMEANNAVFQSTPHKCDEANNGHYESCDRGGCDENTRDHPQWYGPGSSFDLDTRKPFEVFTMFPEKKGKLAGMKTILHQGDVYISLEHGSCMTEYFQALTKPMAEGMSLRITYWGDQPDDMQWMDMPPCGPDACKGGNAGTGFISNITIGKIVDVAAGQTVKKDHPTPAPWEIPAPAPSWEEPAPSWEAPAPSWEETTAAPAPVDSVGSDYFQHPIGWLGSDLVLAGRGGQTTGDLLSMEHGDEFTVFSSYVGQWAPEEIHQVKLLGKQISFTVDLSKVGCACNLALYLISSPARNFDNKPNVGKDRGGQPPYYCDANQVGGQWCPEIDLMEANNHVFQSTPHKCDTPVSGHYLSCDRGGCDENTRDKPNSYGPGRSYTINTDKPFKVTTEFMDDGGILVGMRTTLRQADRRLELAHSKCDAEYLAELSEPLKAGMSIRITYWGDDAETMQWMDVPPCGEQQCAKGNSGMAQFSNMTVADMPKAEAPVASVADHSPLKVNGQAKVLVGSGGEANGDALKIGWNSGFTLFEKYSGEWVPEDISQLKLLGQAITYTVDLSKVGCGCNLAFYLISMPARGPDGQPNKGGNRDGQPKFYCDANQVGGQWCPEMDIMEANSAAFQATPHKCDEPSNGHYESCDRGGCEDTTRNTPDAYGPGSQFRIDTGNPFEVRTEFFRNGDDFVKMRTILQQTGRRVVLEHSNCAKEYLMAMSKAMAAGMSLRITYWGGDAETMSWMDMPPCGQQDCNKMSAGNAVISNLTIEKLPEQEEEIEGGGGVDTTQFEHKGIAVTGVEKAVMLMAGSGGHVKGDTLTMNNGAGYSLFTSYKKAWEPNKIAQLKLMNKTISFTVDLSRVGCACNLAFYLISSPALGEDGNPNRGTNRGGQPPYYCDANKVGAQWCPEIDIMEANSAAFQSTAHKCDRPSSKGHYRNCDRGGCEQTTRDMDSAYGPKEWYSINTLLPFNVSTEFFTKKGVFSAMRTTLDQAGKQVVLEHSNCKEEYMARLSDALEHGMSLRITYWGDEAETMSWMDAPPCGPEVCRGTNAGPGFISNIAVGPLLPSVEPTQGLAGVPLAQPQATAWSVPAAPAWEESTQPPWPQESTQPPWPQPVQQPWEMSTQPPWDQESAQPQLV